MTDVAAVQPNGYHPGRVHAGCLNFSQFGVHALAHSQRARPHSAGTVAFSNGQEHSQHVGRMLVRQAGGKFTLHALQFRRYPAPLGLSRPTLSAATLGKPGHTKRDIAKQTTKPRLLVVLNRGKLAAASAWAAFIRDALELGRHDLMLQPRQNLLAFKQIQPKQRHVVNLDTTYLPKRHIGRRPILVGNFQYQFEFQRPSPSVPSATKCQRLAPASRKRSWNAAPILSNALINQSKFYAASTSYLPAFSSLMAPRKNESVAAMSS